MSDGSSIVNNTINCIGSLERDNEGCSLMQNSSALTSGTIGDQRTTFVSDPVSDLMLVFVSVYAIICAAGTTGNALVVYVIIRFAKMRSVTNTYILNLAISDFCFLVGLPFLIVTAVRQMWIFGLIMCKIFYSLTAINWFTSIFTLTVLSCDRYFAICHAVGSVRYRTRPVANCVCLGIWVASFLVMIPIFLYGKTVDESGRTSCTIDWPEGQVANTDQAFVWYAFSLGFAIPLGLISIFYGLVLVRLQSVGPRHKTQKKKKKRSHNRATHMVLAVIAVYVVCWLPYWIFQITLLFVELPKWTLHLFQLLTILSYANSALNPFLYAFLSENFRNSFGLAFRCQGDEVDVTASLRLLAEQVFSLHGRKATLATVTLGNMPSVAVATSVCANSHSNTVATMGRKGAKVETVKLEPNDVDGVENGSVLEMEELLINGSDVESRRISGLKVTAL